MAYYNVPQTFKTADGSGIMLVYKDKIYVFGNPDEYHQYSQLNRQLGIPDQQATAKTTEGLTWAKLSEFPSPEQMRQAGETAIRGGSTPGTAGATSGEGGPFAYNFEKETEAAFEKLRPYYEKMLSLAKGDVELAKRMIQKDYDLGVRETKEEAEIKSRERALATQRVESRYELGKAESEEEAAMQGRLRELDTRKIESKYGLSVQEAEEQSAIQNKLIDLEQSRIQAQFGLGTAEAQAAHAAAIREQSLLFPEERAQQTSTLGRRGLTGTAGTGLPTEGLAGQEVSKLKESQSIRKEAVDRALKERELRLMEEKRAGEEKAAIAGESEQQKLARALGTLGAEKGFGLEAVGLAGETSEQRLARSLAELEATKGFGATEIGTEQAAAEQRMARALETEEAKKGFLTEEQTAKLEKGTQELSKAHDTEAARMAGESFSRETTLEAMQRSADLAARQEQLAKEQFDWTKSQYNR